jgi:DNA-binding transcriptional LysR family regulator
VTPTQLRTFAAIARHGSSKAAAAELGVTEAAVSGQVAALRKELGDQLFRRSGAGLGFTPGGLRLASRSVELLGLQDLTRREIRAAADGQRILRLAVSSLFGELYAPGLIELFSRRADDIEVEMSVWPTDRFARLLAARAVDVAIGPSPTVWGGVSPDGGGRDAGQRDGVRLHEFLRYQLVAVVGAGHELAARKAASGMLAHQTWLLGPTAVDPGGGASLMLERFEVPERNQRIFQNHAAALTEARAGRGIALCAAHAVSAELADGRLVRVQAPGSMIDGTWATFAVRNEETASLSSELTRFVSTPRAIQAMLSGSGTDIGRFRPRVHVTLWS